MARRSKEPGWVGLEDEELLDVRFCDLGLRLAECSVVARRVEALHLELERRGLRFRPHVWFSDEWFSPDGIPGIAIPFYLGHSRLRKLERRLLYDVEGGTQESCMRLLRHEAGHAIDSAYRLRNRRRWRALFGPPQRTYPRYYRPKLQSRDFVLHLDSWYAQSHPLEDFAETFAVWLAPGASWRKQYADWPALRKLEYVDEVMQEIGKRSAVVRTRSQYEPTRTDRRTLREHYRRRREEYAVEVPELYDEDLLRLFGQPTPGNGSRRSAATFLTRAKRDLSAMCSRGTGEHPYAFAQWIQEMIVRCRELGLKVERADEDVLLDLAIYVSVRAVNHLHGEHHQIPMV